MAAKILQVNFKLNVSKAEWDQTCQSVAQVFADVPGLQWKIWLLNEHDREAGGIYLFESAAALDAYLSGPLAAKVKTMPLLRDFSAKQFDVMPAVTAITRGPVTPAVQKKGA